ncbi:hypothetical protein XFF6992_50144 [Xanthomonas citri pv. fuscans]|nr:hypothetical protein XFF6992_50144 [Xanthomonas citri pv. fuscans]SOO33828.1 hypothetical protein XFF6994_320021 [Xanthomonas citri pv. fuscans]
MRLSWARAFKPHRRPALMQRACLPPRENGDRQCLPSPACGGKVPEGRMGAVDRHNQLAADLGLAILRPGVQAPPARFPPPALHATSPASGRSEAQRS